MSSGLSLSLGLSVGLGLSLSLSMSISVGLGLSLSLSLSTIQLRRVSTDTTLVSIRIATLLLILGTGYWTLHPKLESIHPPAHTRVVCVYMKKRRVGGGARSPTFGKRRSSSAAINARESAR